jgi:hypothetical protein
MKFFISLILTALVSFALGFYMSWWSVAIAAFVVAALIRQTPGKSWLAGFLGVFLLWAIIAWWIDVQNQNILSQKIARLIPLGGSTFLLILVTAFIGALVAGFGALTGSYLRK